MFCLLLLPKAHPGGKELQEKHCTIHPQIRDRTWPNQAARMIAQVECATPISCCKIAMNMILLVNTCERVLWLQPRETEKGGSCWWLCRTLFLLLSSTSLTPSYLDMGTERGIAVRKAGQGGSWGGQHRPGKWGWKDSLKGLKRGGEAPAGGPLPTSVGSLVN